MTHQPPDLGIRHVPSDSAEYARDYTNGWNASRRAADGALDRADARHVSHAWYDGYEDYAIGNDKWTKRDERLAGDHEPEPAAAVPAGLDVKTATDALAAALAALDIPNAATVGGQETRDKILVEQAGHARLMLATILGHDTHDPGWAIGYLRDRLAEHLATGYKTWDQRMVELDAAKPVDGAR